MDDQPINQDEFLRKIEDTHDEFLLHEKLSGKPRVSSGDAKMVYSKGVKQPEGKKQLEKIAWDEKEERTRALFFDLLNVRQKELFDKNDFPITHVVNAIIKLMPQRTENKTESVHTFSDAIKQLKFERENYKTFDAEGNPI